ncbi:MAG: hypothetical protein KF718_31795 [Polyangiaceae bacterium]|nr:hypothetical protein [Polyangiaceae bacterium]
MLRNPLPEAIIVQVEVRIVLERRITETPTGPGLATVRQAISEPTLAPVIPLRRAA